VFAQAYINPKGSGTFSISYQNAYVKDHLFGTGQNFRPNDPNRISTNGEIRTHAMFFNIEYSITDRLAISGGIPYITSKYTEGKDVPFNGVHVFWEPGVLPNDLTDDILITNPDGTPYNPLDDGKYHGSFQDVSARLRYNAISNPFFITPFVEYSTPSNEYPFYAHVAVGNRVSEFRIGTYFGISLDPYLPRTSLQARYAFGFPQRIIGISRTRQHAEIDVTFSLTDSIGIFGVLLGQTTSGGLDLPISPNRSYNPNFYHHIQIQRDNLLDAGIGFQYSLTDRVTLFGVVVHTLTARNMHALNYSFTFGTSWGFGGTPVRPCNC
jgi:hypothetical protein